MDDIEKFIALEEKNRTGTLRFFGCWFGRPYDNFHTAIAASFDTGTLNIKFNEDEVLSIVEPKDIKIRSHNQRSGPLLSIKRASLVTWNWYLYGRKKSTKNLVTLEYGYKNGEIFSTSTSSSFPSGLASPEESAVELI